MSLLRRELPKVVRGDDNTLQVAVPQGSSFFRNSLRLADGGARPPTRKEIDTCLATGRYVSNVESWVNA
jgi:hypothetical protein